MADPAEPTRLRIATRASQLAVWQAEHVADLLRAARPGVEVELVRVTTEGDRRTDVPLSVIGGKGVFATEVQSAVLEGRAELAVHSGKDLPAVTGEGLHLAAVPRRGDPRDALVGAALDDLPEGAVVATGSIRRRAQLADLRPDLRFAELRGNMATRLAKAEHFDAIVVAAAALGRLGLEQHLTEVLPVERFIPQVAQGALVVECRAGEPELAALLQELGRDDPPRSTRAGFLASSAVTARSRRARAGARRRRARAAGGARRGRARRGGPDGRAGRRPRRPRHPRGPHPARPARRPLRRPRAPFAAAYRKSGSQAPVLVT